MTADVEKPVYLQTISKREQDDENQSCFVRAGFQSALTVAALPLPDSPVCLGRWYTPAVPKKRKLVRLTAAQIEIVGKFNDLSLEKPRMTFEQVARKMFGLIPFSKTTSGRRFEKECRKVFDR